MKKRIVLSFISMTLICSATFANFVSLNNSKKVDVVILVDNSASMGPFQKKLANSLDLILKDIINYDLNVGVLTSSSGGGLSPNFVGGRFVVDTDPLALNKDPMTQIQKNILSVGVHGDYTEKFYPNILASFVENPGFYRPDAELYIVIVSDTTDQSDLSEYDFIGLLSSKKHLDLVHLIGIVPMDNTSCPKDDPKASPESDLKKLVNIVDLKIFDICQL